MSGQIGTKKLVRCGPKFGESLVHSMMVRILTQEEVIMLEVVRHKTFFLSAPIDGCAFAQQEQVRDVDIRVFPQDVGFGVVLEMAEVPPMGGSTLQ